METVLNSRCSSDFDGDPKRNHWGSYVNTRPPRRIINHILRCCRVPRFSESSLEAWFEGDYLVLGFEKKDDFLEDRILHIESGMQHEAVHLSCAALGVGTCIHNMGVNGTENEGRIITARHLILEMADCYGDGKYTEATPGPETPFQKGENLPEPERTGETECLPQLERLAESRTTGASATNREISQLLWAAKGITPHYVKGHPWGLTIPTWGHGTEFTTVYVSRDQELFRYVNWTKQLYSVGRSADRLLRYAYWRLHRKPAFHIMGNPTHDLAPVKKVDLSSQTDGSETAIILSQNERTNRTLWEVGYMLENMLLQSRSLGISCKTKILSPSEISRFAELGVKDAVAAVLL